MPDQAQSTDVPQSPSPPVVSSIFRESFLTNFEQPEHEAALRLLADLAALVLSEGRDYIAVDGRDLWPYLVRGAVGDLRQAANALAEVARDLDETRDREAVRAVLAVADAAVEVEPIAARLDAMLARYLVAEVGDDE